MSTKVLFVDDDPNILSAHQRNFRGIFPLDVAAGADDALRMLERDSYAVIVSDMRMPGLSGVEFLEKSREVAPDTVRMMLTGNIDQPTATEAINKGNVYRFLTKPCPAETLRLSIEDGLRQYRLVTGERQLLQDTLGGAIKVLADVLAIVDTTSFGIAQRLRECVRLFVASHRIADAWSLEVAALLSQIGFVMIPPEVAQKIHKGVALSAPESEMMERSVGVAQDLIRNIPRLDPVAEIVLYQWKHYDGTGAPHDAIRGKAIPHGARLIKIFLEVIRRESRGSSRFEAIHHIQSHPSEFDPDLAEEVRAFLHINDDVVLSAAPAACVRREIKLAQLEIGQKLVTGIMTPDGLMVVAGGSEITPLLLERVRNFAALQRLVEPIVIEAAPA
jgi:response regulator RpfG family c-di-GMP phosphodiesterase